MKSSGRYFNCLIISQNSAGFLAFATAMVFCICLLSCKSRPDSETRKVICTSYIRQPAFPAWDSPAWNDTVCIVIDGEKESSENKMVVYSVWNQDSLWFFFKVTDSDLRAFQTDKDHPQLYLDDMVEVLIDTRNDKDSCWNLDDIVYHINILGEKKDDRGTPECVTNPLWDGVARITVELFGTVNDSTDIDTGYLVTLSFPWDEIEQTPLAGLTMGINFANGDNDGKGRQLFDRAGAWPMRSPYAFENLVLR